MKVHLVYTGLKVWYIFDDKRILHGQLKSGWCSLVDKWAQTSYKPEWEWERFSHCVVEYREDLDDTTKILEYIRIKRIRNCNG